MSVWCGRAVVWALGKRVWVVAREAASRCKFAHARTLTFMAPPPQTHARTHASPSLALLAAAAATSTSQIKSRSKAIHAAEKLLRRLTSAPGSGVQFVEDSRWMSIYEETSYMVGEILCAP